MGDGVAALQKYRLYLKRVSGVHTSGGARGKGGKGGSDAAFQALMGAHGIMPMAAGMQPGMMAQGMAHLAGSAGPPRELMHQMQMQQVRLGAPSARFCLLLHQAGLCPANSRLPRCAVWIGRNSDVRQ